MKVTQSIIDLFTPDSQ